MLLKSAVNCTALSQSELSIFFMYIIINIIILNCSERKNRKINKAIDGGASAHPTASYFFLLL